MSEPIKCEWYDIDGGGLEISYLSKDRLTSENPSFWCSLERRDYFKCNFKRDVGWELLEILEPACRGKHPDWKLAGAGFKDGELVLRLVNLKDMAGSENNTAPYKEKWLYFDKRLIFAFKSFNEDGTPRGTYWITLYEKWGPDGEGRVNRAHITNSSHVWGDSTDYLMMIGNEQHLQRYRNPL